MQYEYIEKRESVVKKKIRRTRNNENYFKVILPIGDLFPLFLNFLASLPLHKLSDSE